MAFKLSMATVKSIVKTTGRFIEKNAPVIAAGAGVAAMISAVVASAKAAPEVKEAIYMAENQKNEQALKERFEDGNDSTPIVDLTLKEKFPIYAKYYWKTVLLMLLSGTCIVGSVYFSNKQIRAMAIVAAAAESNLGNLEEATKAIVGEKKFDQIKEKLIDDKLERNPPSDEFIADTGNGKTLCYEYWYGTYFWSDISAVKTAIANYMMDYTHSQQTYMSDLYEYLGIPDAFVPGLASDEGHFCDPDEAIENKPDYDQSSKIVKLNGVDQTCYVIKMTRPRKYDDLFNEALAKRGFR